MKIIVVSKDILAIVSLLHVIHPKRYFSFYIHNKQEEKNTKYRHLADKTICIHDCDHIMGFQKAAKLVTQQNDTNWILTTFDIRHIPAFIAKQADIVYFASDDLTRQYYDNILMQCSAHAFCYQSDITYYALLRKKRYHKTEWSTICLMPQNKQQKNCNVRKNIVYTPEISQ